MGLESGRLRLVLSLNGTRMTAGHDVDPQAPEPGVPEAEQPHRHELASKFIDTTLLAELEVSEHLGVYVMLPYRVVDQDFELLGAEGQKLDRTESIHHQNRTLTGLGDMAVGGLLALSAKGSFTQLRLGLTLPTGSTRPDPYALGRLGKTHQHVFLGSGTLGLQAAVDASYDLGPAALLVSGSTRVALGENEHGYRAPIVATAGLGLETPFDLENWRFRSTVELSRETKAKWPTWSANNMGRTELSVGLGTTWSFATDLQLSLNLKHPFTLSTEGGSLSIPLIVQLSLGYVVDVF